MRVLALLVAAFACAAFSTSADAAPQRHSRKESPFEALRWKENKPEVRVASVWYRPVSIDSVLVTEILAFCDKRWPGDKQRRFGEDLVEAMVLMGHTPPAAVDLEVEPLDGGARTTLKGVAMSAENRKSIRDAGDVEPASAPRPARVLTRDAALADIDAFAAGLEARFAYYAWREIDLDAQLQAVRAELADDVTGAWLAARLHRVLMLFGDGHAGVTSRDRSGSRSFPPALLEQSGAGVIALRPDRSALLDPERPYVVSIDGEPLSAWLNAIAPSIVAGSPQVVRLRSLRGLRELESLRAERGLPAAKTVRYGLAPTPDGAAVELELELSGRRPTYGEWPQRSTARLAGDIGYLRLERMLNERIPDLHEAMQSFRDTRGLIVDVRGNGGGSRGLLLALGGYLGGPDEGPWVGNIAAYREADGFDADHLEARYMYRADDARWSDAQRAAIEQAAQSFEPEWTLPDGFSAWHYLVLDRSDDEGVYFYDKPVIVLSDALCFSATDIFLGALKDRPRVTLMGAPSGGGSARTQGFTLPSGLRVQCASMASFRADGRTYDGRGIEVDVQVPNVPTDFLAGSAGGTDSVFAAALARLRER